jgi:hypothetical protein
VPIGHDRGFLRRHVGISQDGGAHLRFFEFGHALSKWQVGDLQICLAALKRMISSKRGKRAGSARFDLRIDPCAARVCRFADFKGTSPCIWFVVGLQQRERNWCAGLLRDARQQRDLV